MLGDKIRMFRLERKLEIEALAEIIGISAMAIYYYEENKWRPGTEIIVRLAHAFGVELTELVEECTMLHKENGEILMVCNTTGNKIKILGKVTEEVQKLCRKEVQVL